MVASSEGPGVGVFGAGVLARALVPLLRHHGFRVVALWDRSIEQAQSDASLLDVSLHTCCMDDVLVRPDVQLVLVLAAPALHARITAKALGIGKHVVAAWPAALEQTQLARAALAAQYYPAVVAGVGGLALRFLPAVQQARDLVVSGRLGAVTCVEARLRCGGVAAECYDWRCERQMGGGASCILAAQLIDVVQEVSGQLVRRVSGCVRGGDTECLPAPAVSAQWPEVRRVAADSLCYGQLELSEGAVASLVVNTLLPPLSCTSPAVQFELVVCGSEGCVQVDSETARWCSCGGSWQLLTPSHSESCVSSEDSACMPRLLVLGWSQLLADMVTLWRQHGELSRPSRMASLSSAQQILAVVEALRRSHETRCWTQVNVQQTTSESA